MRGVLLFTYFLYFIEMISWSHRTSYRGCASTPDQLIQTIMVFVSIGATLECFFVEQKD